MVRNERSILRAESRCLCFREYALAAVEEEGEEEAKKLNSLLSPHKICSFFPTDLQLAIPISPNIPALLCFFSPPITALQKEEEKRLSTTILLETIDRQTNRLADTHTHTHTHTHKTIMYSPGFFSRCCEDFADCQEGFEAN